MELRFMFISKFNICDKWGYGKVTPVLSSIENFNLDKTYNKIHLF